MRHNINNKKAFTLVELIVAMLIVAFIGTFAWKIYLNSQETMRHTVSQSQIQADIRIFLDKLETEMMTCYAFDNIDSENKKFSFYSFTYGNVPLEEIYYNGGEIRNDSEDPPYIKVKKIEYSWTEDGKVKKTRTPGFLYFLLDPMDPNYFKETSSGVDDEDKKMTNEELRDISGFEVKGYVQSISNNSDNEIELKIEPVSDPVVPSHSATFIVLRLHAFKDEKGNKRDEEIDVVTKFYSPVKIADDANPGSFCSTDNDGSF